MFKNTHNTCVSKNVEKLEFSYNVGGNVNWKTVQQYQLKAELHISYN